MQAAFNLTLLHTKAQILHGLINLVEKQIDNFGEILGPDLCLADADIAEAVRRFSLRPDDAPIVDVLLDQRICCGVGNVYKSEVLFACGLHPLTPIGSIDHDHRTRLVTTANRLLRDNLGSGPRVTVSGSAVGAGDGLAVYGRRGLPCLRCTTPIVYGLHGRHHRSSYWCPNCQPAG